VRSEQIADLALKAGVSVYGIEEERANLEQLYFSLTQGQYTPGVVGQQPYPQPPQSPYGPQGTNLSNINRSNINRRRLTNRSPINRSSTSRRRLTNRSPISHSNTSRRKLTNRSNINRPQVEQPQPYQPPQALSAATA